MQEKRRRQKLSDQLKEVELAIAKKKAAQANASSRWTALDGAWVEIFFKKLKC